MRTDLETAMSAVLTSRAAADLILEAPGEFAGHFPLTAGEIAALSDMAADLAGLMPGLVRKRERGLRASMPVTISALGAAAAALVEDYTETHAPAESAAADALRFADYLVTATDTARAGQPVADVARLERMRLLAFCTEWPLRPVPPSPAGDGPFWLCHSAAAERFTFDVRTVRSERAAEVLARLRPDPACLLCFQRPDDGEVVVLRLDADIARAVALIGSRPGELTAGDLGQPAGLARLIALGVVRGSGS